MVTAVVTALLTVATTYLALVTRIRSELEAQYDKELRELRLTAYAALWALTEPLARYSPAKALTPDGACLLSKRLRAWYFRDGMVLSAKAREAYFALQEELTAQPMPAIEHLRGASSAMHAALTSDVGSRRPPLIGFKRKGWLGSPEGGGGDGGRAASRAPVR